MTCSGDYKIFFIDFEDFSDDIFTTLPDAKKFVMQKCLDAVIYKCDKSGIPQPLWAYDIIEGWSKP